MSSSGKPEGRHWEGKNATWSCLFWSAEWIGGPSEDCYEGEVIAGLC